MHHGGGALGFERAAAGPQSITHASRALSRVPASGPVATGDDGRGGSQPHRRTLHSWLCPISTIS